MNIYDSLSQDILIDGDLYFPVISQKEYDEVVVEVSRELKKIGKNLIEFFKQHGSCQSQSNQTWLEEMIASLDEAKFFKENMEICRRYQFYWRDGFLELFVKDCRNDVYDKGQELMQAWYQVSHNGLLAIRSVLRS